MLEKDSLSDHKFIYSRVVTSIERKQFKVLDDEVNFLLNSLVKMSKMGRNLGKLIEYRASISV